MLASRRRPDVSRGTRHPPNFSRMNRLDGRGMDPLMRQSFIRVSRAAIVAAAGALAACTSSLPDFSQFKLPTARTLMPANVDTYVPPVSARAVKSIGPSDLVDAQGTCAALAPPAAAPQANQASDSA